MRERVIGWVTTAVMFTAALAACTTTTEQGAVGVERRQLLLVSSAEMDQGATAAYQNVLKEQGAKGAVNKDPQQVARVRRIAARLTPQKMAKASTGGGPPQILSTHPSSDDRIKDLQVFAQRVLPLYEQARAK